MSATNSFVLQVERVQPGCTVPQGQRISPPTGHVVLGRSSDATVVLDDVSVSRLHCELRATGSGFVVRSLTRSGSTFVNSRALREGEELVVEQTSTWLQIGRILMRVTVAPSTLPAEPMDLPEGAAISSGALIVIRRGKTVRVRLGGHAAQLFPSATRVLACLCETPGAVVTHEQLLAAVDPDNPDKAGGAPMPQLVTYVRDAFSDAIEARWLDPEVLRVLVGEAAPELADELAGSGPEARRALLRVLVCNKRGLGYVLHLPPRAVVVL